MAATSKPDGYTFSQIPDATYRVPLMRKSPWDPERDFTYIIGLYAYAFGPIVPADSPFKTQRTRRSSDDAAWCSLTPTSMNIAAAPASHRASSPPGMAGVGVEG